MPDLYVGTTLNSAQCEGLRILLESCDGPVKIVDQGDSVLILAGSYRYTLAQNGSIHEETSGGDPE